jgi:hypothetical protein
MKRFAPNPHRLCVALLIGLACAAALADVLAGPFPVALRGSAGTELLPGRLPVGDEAAIWPIWVAVPNPIDPSTVTEVIVWWIRGFRTTFLPMLAAALIAAGLGWSLGTAARIDIPGAATIVARATELSGAAPTVLLSAMVIALAPAHATSLLPVLIGLHGATVVAKAVRAPWPLDGPPSTVPSRDTLGLGIKRALRIEALSRPPGSASLAAALAGPALVTVESSLYYLKLVPPSASSWVSPLVAPDASKMTTVIAALTLLAVSTAGYALVRTRAPRARKSLNSSPVGIAAAPD